MLCIGSAIVVEKSDPSCWHTADSAALTGSLGSLGDPKSLESGDATLCWFIYT
jgi:hypothetical protein